MPSAELPPLLKDAATDPGVFPQRIDFLHQAMLFVRLSQQQFHDASFLDDRILTPQTEHAWVRFDGVQAMLANAAPTTPLHLILHAGHVGSTLLSRLVEEAGGVLGLREPLTLRALAEANDLEVGGGGRGEIHKLTAASILYAAEGCTRWSSSTTCSRRTDCRRS